MVLIVLFKADDYHRHELLGMVFLPQVGIALKPFLPQLQTTFTKALQDCNRGVRLKAADALGKLISIHIKVDPLFTELLNGIRVTEDSGIRYSAASRATLVGNA